MEYKYNRPRLALRLRHLTVAALLTGAATGAQAQDLNFPESNAQNLAGTYTDLGTTGTAITMASSDDANSAAQLIGFPFAYNGLTMDRFIMNTNGFLKLGAANMAAPTVNLYTIYAQSNNGGTLLNTAADNVNLISPFNFDLLAGTSPAEYRMATTGAVGSRICTIQWKNVADKALPSTTATSALVGSQFANMSFQVKLYEANNSVDFVYGPVTPAAAANNNFKYSQCGLKGSGNGPNQILRVFKGSMIQWGDATSVNFAAGPVTAGATGALNFRQAVPPDNGRTFRFLPIVPNDAGVGLVYTLNQLAVPGATPQVVRAVVINSGSNDQVGLSVTLNVTGANTFTNVQTIGLLAASDTAYVTFAPYTPVLGTNTVRVSVPNDDNNGNSSASETQVVNPTTFSYITPGRNNSSGTRSLVGMNGGFAAKFQLATPRTVTAVRAFIADFTPSTTTKSTVGETLYAVVMDPATGNVLGRSTNYVVQAADANALHTFTLTTPVAVPAGDLMVGMVQAMAPTAPPFYYPMGVQTEDPLRTNSFYTISADASPSVPVDVAGTASGFGKYMLEAVVTGPITCNPPTALTVTGTSTTASVAFTGPVNGTGYQVVYGVTGFNPASAGTTTPTFTVAPSAVTGLTAATCYDFYVRAVCSATDQSQLAGPFKFCTPCTPPTISTFPYAQNFDVVSAGQALPCGITVTDSNNDGYTWQAKGSVTSVPGSTSIARSAPNAMVYTYNDVDITAGANDWFYTPALTLAANQKYRVSFYYRVAAGGYSERLEVKYGAAATPAGQTNLLYTNTNITSAAYLLANNASTPAVLDISPAAGTYYVGFHAISLANQAFLAVDDVAIAASPLATSEALKRAVSVFPNPSTSGFFSLEIHGANAKQALSVEVTNLLGQRVYTGTAKDNFRSEVDLSSLASGIYSLKVRNGEEYTMQQISIVK